MTGVFYGPHSSYEHMWIRHKDDLETILNNQGRPRVYVSFGKHASYPIHGRGAPHAHACMSDCFHSSWLVSGTAHGGAIV